MELRLKVKFTDIVNQTSSNTTSLRKEFCLQNANLVQGHLLFTVMVLIETQTVESYDKLIVNNELERIWKERSCLNLRQHFSFILEDEECQEIPQPV
jgi:hypothetical protein